MNVGNSEIPGASTAGFLRDAQFRSRAGMNNFSFRDDPWVFGFAARSLPARSTLSNRLLLPTRVAETG